MNTNRHTMGSTINALNNSQTLKIYWLFLYSYSDNVTKPLPSDKILLFPLSLYTVKRGSLLAFMSEKTLDMDTDEDLDMIITKFKLNYVRSVSEMVVSKTTNLIAIQIDSNKKLKGYTKQNQIYFYTLDRTPMESINEGILTNKHLLNNIVVSIGSRNIINTNVTMEKIFNFLFKEHFEVIANFNSTRNEIVSREMCKRFVDKDKEDLEDVEDLEDGYSTTDSELSLYSYNKKYNIKDI